VDTWDIGTLDVRPHMPQVLCTDADSRAIAINLPRGELMQEHEVHENSYLFVADGEVEISHADETAVAGVGFVAHFAPHERREVRARSDARLVMVLAPYPALTRRS